MYFLNILCPSLKLIYDYTLELILTMFNFVHYMCTGGGEVLIKAQVLAGGRGMGHFESGLQGGVHIAKS